MRSKLNNLVFYISISILVCSCYINHGNRFPDINFEWQSNISPYYIHKYMNSLDSFYQNRMEITSEIVNFPDQFVPVTDSFGGFKYVIEFNNMDSLKSLELNYFNLASIYDFKKRRWVTDRNDLKDGELKKFQLFFSENVLRNVVKEFRNSVPDTLLFVSQPHAIILKPLNESIPN